MSLLAKTVHVQQGIVSLPLRCLTRKACKGVLILAAAQGGPKTSPPLQPGELARADLYIPGRTEWIIDVTLTKAGRKYARAHHNVKTLITAFYKNPEGLDPFTLTIVS